VNEATQIPNRAEGPDLDLGALKARLRKQAEARRGAAPGSRQVDAPAFSWPQVQAHLNQATRLAPAPTVVPPLGRLYGPLRRLARLVLRGFLSLARVITVRQGDVNGLLIEAVRETAEGLRDLEKQVARLRERLRQMDAVLGSETGHEVPPQDRDVRDNNRPPMAA
jgi:hypothetical protein